MSHEQTHHDEPDFEDDSGGKDLDSEERRLPQALREQFHRAFTPGVVVVITAFSENPILTP
jgi:hypothetical protein